MADRTEGSIGSADNAAVGQGNTQNIRREQGGATVHFQSQDNAIIWQAIIDLGNSISAVRERLDDLPNRVAKLEVQFQPLPIPLPVTYVPTWIIALMILMGLLVIGGGAFLLGRTLGG